MSHPTDLQDLRCLNEWMLCRASCFIHKWFISASQPHQSRVLCFILCYNFALPPQCFSLVKLWFPACELIFFVVFLFVCAYICVCLSVPSTRRPHHPASIHHSPSPSHPSRSYCTIRHPRLRPHSHWQQRYSTKPHASSQKKTFRHAAVSSRFSQLSLSFCFPIYLPLPIKASLILSNVDDDGLPGTSFSLWYLILSLCLLRSHWCRRMTCRGCPLGFNINLIIQISFCLQGSLTHCIQRKLSCPNTPFSVQLAFQRLLCVRPETSKTQNFISSSSASWFLMLCHI